MHYVREATHDEFNENNIRYQYVNEERDNIEINHPKPRLVHQHEPRELVAGYDPNNNRILKYTITSTGGDNLYSYRWRPAQLENDE